MATKLEGGKSSVAGPLIFSIFASLSIYQYVSALIFQLCRSHGQLVLFFSILVILIKLLWPINYNSVMKKKDKHLKVFIMVFRF